VLFVAALAVVLYLSGMHQATSPEGLPVIGSAEEYQDKLGQADELWKPTMIKLDKDQKLTQDDLTKLSKAKDLYIQLNHFEPTKMGPVFAMGRIELVFNRPDEAEVDFKQAIDNSDLQVNQALGTPVHLLAAESHYFLAQCYELKFQWNDAVAESSKAISMNPDSPPYYFVRGKAEMQLNQLAKADADIKKCLEEDPTLQGAQLIYTMIHDPTRKR
jgi:tetratricopeptide (TPR) repeat protein